MIAWQVRSKWAEEGWGLHRGKGFSLQHGKVERKGSAARVPLPKSE